MKICRQIWHPCRQLSVEYHPNSIRGLLKTQHCLPRNQQSNTFPAVKIPNPNVIPPCFLPLWYACYHLPLPISLSSTFYQPHRTIAHCKAEPCTTPERSFRTACLLCALCAPVPSPIIHVLLTRPNTTGRRRLQPPSHRRHPTQHRPQTIFLLCAELAVSVSLCNVRLWPGTGLALIGASRRLGGVQSCFTKLWCLACLCSTYKAKAISQSQCAAATDDDGLLPVHISVKICIIILYLVFYTQYFSLL